MRKSIDVGDGEWQDDDDVRAIGTNVPYELESVEEEVEERIARQERQCKHKHEK